MKKSGLLLLILTMLSVSAFTQRQYTINGTAPDEYNGNYVYLALLDIDSPIAALPTYTDSAYIDKGKFVFKGELPSDKFLYSILLNKIAGGLVALDSEQLCTEYVEGDPFGHFRTSGSALNEHLTQFTEYPKELSGKFAKLMKHRAELLAKDEWTLEDEAKFEENQKIETINFVDLISTLVKDNVSNPVGQYFLVLMAGNIKKEVMDEIEPKLSEDVKQKIKDRRESMAKMMASQSTEDKVKADEEYIDFEGEMLSREKVKLSSVIKSKKLVLLDFWASWCVPCLKEMPEIINLHDKYKGRGLEIIGVSLDKSRDKWKSMVESTGMHWIQFIDSNMSNRITDMYGVRAIPHTVLIDQHGKIVATNLRGKELREKIEELLSE